MEGGLKIQFFVDIIYERPLTFYTKSINFWFKNKKKISSKEIFIITNYNKFRKMSKNKLNFVNWTKKLL